jgi:hypothetical protein
MRLLGYETISISLFERDFAAGLLDLSVLECLVVLEDSVVSDIFGLHDTGAKVGALWRWKEIPSNAQRIDHTIASIN